MQQAGFFELRERQEKRLVRETLREAGAVEQLFAQFDGMLNAHGLKASGGQIIRSK